jgi:L,D-transpeptidase catalytic domain
MSARRRHLALAAAALAIAQALAFGSGVSAASTDPAAATEQPPATAPPPSGPEPPATTTPAPPAVPTTLSNERTLTTWAHPVEEVAIHEHPLTASRTIAHTRLETEDGFPEVYVVLASYTDAASRAWIHVRIPTRPNGRTGWLPQEALGEFHVTRWLVEISLGRRLLRAYYKGKLRFSAPVGVGKPSTPTPTGHFWIRERFKLASRSNPYWPYAIGTSAYSRLTDWPGGGVVGIHGDFGEPQAIPGDPSHGCVRMRDPDLAWLAPRLQLGTPVHIVR